MSESIIQTHTSSLLEEGGGGGKGEWEGGREEKERKEGIKDGERERWKGKCVLASISIYMFHEDESKCDMDVMLCYLRRHFKFTYQEGGSSFKMAPLSPGSQLKRIFKQLVFSLVHVNRLGRGLRLI